MSEAAPPLGASGKSPVNTVSESSAKAESATGFVKLDTRKLDSLVDLVGELVIAQSMVVQDPEVQRLSSRHLARTLRQLGRITTELQRTAMSLRMVPIRRTFQKMTRLVRDMERDGLVTRQADPGDGRGVLIKASPRGRALVERVRNAKIALVRDHLVTLDARTRARVRTAFAALESLAEPPSEEAGG